MFDIEYEMYSLWGSFTDTFKRIELHYGLWENRSAIRFDELSCNILCSTRTNL